MTPLIQKVLAPASEQLHEVNALIITMRPPLGSPGRPQCALFLTIAEQFESVVRLAQANLLTHSAVHVRSMLEAAADLRLLGSDPEHIDRMKYDQAAGERRFYEQLLASDRLPDDVRQYVDARQPLCIERYTPLHERFKRRKLSQADLFLLADMSYVIGYYTMLCSFSHNDLTALSLRHQGDRSMTHRATPPDSIAFLVMQLASTALMLATEQMRAIALFPEGEFELRFGAMNRAFAALLQLCPGDDDDSGNEESRPEAALGSQILR